MTEHQTPPIDKKGLREFGLVLGGLFAGIFGVLLPLLHGDLFSSPPIWPWVIAVPLWFLAIASPGTLKPVYHFWMKIGLWLSKIMTPLWMGLVFYLVVVPMGFMMRWFGKDPMNRELSAAIESYRVPSQLKTKESMEKPF
ncbi:MAG: sxtJ [Okeania sp. SIO2H7]|nr:sxtJ [Okeania sp. SIO2H7]